MQDGREMRKGISLGSSPGASLNLASTATTWLFPMARIVWSASETCQDDRAARGVMATHDCQMTGGEN